MGRGSSTVFQDLGSINFGFRFKNQNLLINEKKKPSLFNYYLLPFSLFNFLFRLFQNVTSLLDFKVFWYLTNRSMPPLGRPVEVIRGMEGLETNQKRAGVQQPLMSTSFFRYWTVHSIRYSRLFFFFLLLDSSNLIIVYSYFKKRLKARTANVVTLWITHDS